MFADDIDALSSYYQKVFGFAEVAELTSPHFRGLAVGQTILGFSAHSAYELLELTPPAHADDGVRSFLTFECASDAEVDGLFDAALVYGGTAVQASHRTYYDAWQAVVRDPEGNVFRINHLTLSEPVGPAADDRLG